METQEENVFEDIASRLNELISVNELDILKKVVTEGKVPNYNIYVNCIF